MAAIDTRTKATAILFRRHFVAGWRLVGGYVKKWFLYTLYALAIELVFVAWLLIVGIVTGFAWGVHPWVGWGVGLAALLASPVVLSLLRSGRAGESPG